MVKDMIEEWRGPDDYWSPEIVNIIRDIEKFIKDNRGGTPRFHSQGAVKYVGWILEYFTDNDLNRRTQPDIHKIRQYFEYKYSRV